MMITFVCQYEKKACAGRVLDAFADNIDGNTWQTVITQEGRRKIGAGKIIIESFLHSMLKIEHNGPYLVGKKGIRRVVGSADGF